MYYILCDNITEELVIYKLIFTYLTRSFRNSNKLIAGRDVLWYFLIVEARKVFLVNFKRNIRGTGGQTNKNVEIISALKSIQWIDYYIWMLNSDLNAQSRDPFSVIWLHYVGNYSIFFSICSSGVHYSYWVIGYNNTGRFCNSIDSKYYNSCPDIVLWEQPKENRLTIHNPHKNVLINWNTLFMVLWDKMLQNSAVLDEVCEYLYSPISIVNC